MNCKTAIHSSLTSAFFCNPMLALTHCVFTDGHQNVAKWLPFVEVLHIIRLKKQGIIGSLWRLPTPSEARLIMLNSLVSFAGRSNFYDYYLLEGPFWLDGQNVAELPGGRRSARSHAMLLLVKDDIS